MCILNVYKTRFGAYPCVDLFIHYAWVAPAYVMRRVVHWNMISMRMCCWDLYKFAIHQQKHNATKYAMDKSIASNILVWCFFFIDILWCVSSETSEILKLTIDCQTWINMMRGAMLRTKLCMHRKYIISIYIQIYTCLWVYVCVWVIYFCFLSLAINVCQIYRYFFKICVWYHKIH